MGIALQPFQGTLYGNESIQSSLALLTIHHCMQSIHIKITYHTITTSKVEPKYFAYSKLDFAYSFFNNSVHQWQDEPGFGPG